MGRDAAVAFGTRVASSERPSRDVGRTGPTAMVRDSPPRPTSVVAGFDVCRRRRRGRSVGDRWLIQRNVGDAVQLVHDDVDAGGDEDGEDGGHVDERGELREERSDDPRAPSIPPVRRILSRLV